MTSLRNPFATSSVDVELLAADWRHTLDAMSISGQCILDLFAMWSGEAGVSSEITRLGWTYIRHRDQEEELREQLVDAGYLPA